MMYNCMRLYVTVYGEECNFVAYITTTMGTCNACGATLETFEYQI